MHAISRRRSIMIGSAVAILGLALTNAVAPAMASPPEPAMTPAPASITAQAAAEVVNEYVRAHATPASNAAEFEYFSTFPFAEGLAQWDCELVSRPSRLRDPRRRAALRHPDG
jgi:hypothetical protein